MIISRLENEYSKLQSILKAKYGYDQICIFWYENRVIVLIIWHTNTNFQ